MAREQFLCELFFCEQRERSSFGLESHVTACISGLVLSLPKHKKENEKKKNSLPNGKKSQSQLELTPEMDANTMHPVT